MPRALPSPDSHALLYNVEAEMGVLGSILREPANLPTVRDIVRRADFFRDDHQEIFQALCDLADRGAPIEDLAVDDLLVSRGWSTRKTTAVIGEILEKSALSIDGPYYARIVREKAVLRDADEAASQLRDDIRTQRAPAGQVTAHFLERFSEIRARAIAGPGGGFDLGILGSSTFSSQRFVRRWHIERLFVAGQPMIVGGPRKAMKTSLMVELVIALAAAIRFLGTFVVPRPTRTLLLSGESGDSTLQETARRVCKAKGITLEEVEGLAFWGFVLPQFGDQAQLDALAKFLRENAIEVVIIDPLYLCLMSGDNRVDPANLFEVGPLLAKISRVCLDAGATPVLVHHLRKNRVDHLAPPELEDLAYSGIQEYARQWMLIGRRADHVPGSGEHQLWLNVGGSAGHSGTWALDISEGAMHEDFRDRTWDYRVTSVGDARAEAAAQNQATKAERAGERAKVLDEARERQAQDDADRLIKVVRKSNTPLTKQDLKIATGLRTDRLDRAIGILLHARKAIEETVFHKSCNGGSRPVSGYRSTASNQHPATPGAHPAQHPAPGCPATPGTPGAAAASLPEGEAAAVAPGVAWPGVDAQREENADA